VFYPGGHGPMEDLAVNPDSGRLLASALASGKPLGVVCHAPATDALLAGLSWSALTRLPPVSDSTW
jgi:putative intracellular protease/amidase